MKFDKKFDVKKLIKVSAVALAMISAGGFASAINANTNAHADSIAQEQIAEFAKQDQQKAEQNEAYSRAMNIQKARQYPQFRLIMEQESADAAPDDTNPGSRLTKSDLARIYAPGYKKGNSNEQYKEFKAIKEFRGVKEARHLLHVSYVPSAPTKVAKHSVAKKRRVSTKRTRLSKAPIRKIMNQMNADKKAIRNDNKHLSTRNARKFMHNYTKATKSVKRAMATKGAKRYLHYYKDEVKHENDLNRLTKSTRASKATKRNARKSLKHVHKNIRKNRKNVKRAHMHMINGTKADYRQGEKAGHRYGDYYQYRQMNYGKAIKGLSRNSKLFNKEYVKGFENSADMTNKGDGPTDYNSLIGIAQQYKASHYNPNIIRVVNYLINKTGGGDGDLASSYAKHHPQYRTVANYLAKLINFGTL